MMNEVRAVEGIKVACVRWKSKPFMVIENEETFEDAKQDNFEPIEHYTLQSELIDSLYNVINK